jgi:hypothetical protein
MTYRKLSLLAGLIAVLVAVIASAPSASASATAQPQLIQDSQLQALTTTIGGADVVPTTRTIPHWWLSLIHIDAADD